jgi:hypothetical protein
MKDNKFVSMIRVGRKSLYFYSCPHDISAEFRTHRALKKGASVTCQCGGGKLSWNQAKRKQKVAK